jgi:hypothetical protein
MTPSSVRKVCTIGPNVLDPSRRAAAVEAGIIQADVAERVRAAWLPSGTSA